jgi:hypothetical protein
MADYEELPPFRKAWKDSCRLHRRDQRPCQVRRYWYVPQPVLIHLPISDFDSSAPVLTDYERYPDGSSDVFIKTHCNKLVHILYNARSGLKSLIALHKEQTDNDVCIADFEHQPCHAWYSVHAVLSQRLEQKMASCASVRHRSDRPREHAYEIDAEDQLSPPAFTMAEALLEGDESTGLWGGQHRA